MASITESTSAEGLATQTTKAERAETGVKLQVTPQINRKGEITMVIQPSVTTVKQSTYFDDFVDPQKRTARTTVTICDGETLVIGGLISVEESREQMRLPGLANIPLLGSLFSRKNDSTTDKELIIFITPRLVRENERPELALEKEMFLEKAGNWEDQDMDVKKEEEIEKILDEFEE